MSFSEEEFHQFLSHFRSVSDSLIFQLHKLYANSSRLTQNVYLKQCLSINSDLISEIKKIEPKIRMLPTNQRVRCSAQLIQIQTIHKPIQLQLISLTQQSDVNPTKLLKRDNEYGDERQLLFEAKSSIDRGNDSLNYTNRLLGESHDVGVETKKQLHQQREQFVRSKHVFYETKSLLTESRRVLNRIKRRLIFNQLQTCLIISAELFLICGLIFWRYFA